MIKEEKCNIENKNWRPKTFEKYEYIKNIMENKEETYQEKKNKWLDEAHERGNDYY